jgi:hypothetical protein
MTDPNESHPIPRNPLEGTSPPGPLDRGPQGPVNDLGADDPMDDERCLFTLSLLMDGRSVHPQLADRARAWAEEHPGCHRALGDFEAIRDVLREERVALPSEGFTERVLEEHQQGARTGDVLPLVRRLSLAAALLLALTLGFDLQSPSSAHAGADLAAARHSIDELRPDPFGPAQLEDGLLVLFPDPAPLASQPSAEDVARDPAGDR